MKIKKCSRLMGPASLIAVMFVLAHSRLVEGQAPPVIPAVPVRPMQPPFTPVPGQRMNNNVQYAPMAAPASPYTDVDIQKNIKAQFASDKFLRPFGIRFQSINGVVILTGTADTWQDYFRAEADAYAAGATAVDNRLIVQG